MEKALQTILKDVSAFLTDGEQNLPKIRIGLTVLGSEHGAEEVTRGALLAMTKNSQIEVVAIGKKISDKVTTIEVDTEEEAHKVMGNMLDQGDLQGAVTMHYPFPIGVSTVGKVVTPAFGKELFLATTTGTTDTDRVKAMVLNTIYGIAVAKASGIENPTVGILNLDGARQVERILTRLQENGYDITFTESKRSDGGVVMRGNDLLQATSDIMVMDTLTGNVLMKLFSSYTSGGSYEMLGSGYGPGVGAGFNKIIHIISRASGAPVIGDAILYAGQMVKGQLLLKKEEELQKANQAGLQNLLQSENKEKPAETITAPPKTIIDEELSGVDVMEIEDAVLLMWKNGIYAESGMGCTGPVVMVNRDNAHKAEALLREHNFIA